MRLIFYFIFCIAFLSGCKNRQPDLEKKDPLISEEDDRAWLDWDDCSQVVGDHPCNFSLMNQDGEEVELYDHYGKVIVVDLSAMWCGVCHRIAKSGDELTSSFGSENLVWITILIENESGLPPDQSDLNRWVAMNEVEGDVLAGDDSLIDMNSETGYPVSGWPTLVVIDRTMILKNGIVGWNESLVSSWIESLI
jgi:thiol-disulfide isomerase/thioredoxin